MQVLEVCTLAMPALFVMKQGTKCPLESRKGTNVQMLTEVLLHMLRRYTVCMMQFNIAVCDRAKLLAPVAGCVVNMMYATCPPKVIDPSADVIPVTSCNPFLCQLSTTSEEWTVEQFTALVDMDWKKGMRPRHARAHTHTHTHTHRPHPLPTQNSASTATSASSRTCGTLAWCTRYAGPTANGRRISKSETMRYVLPLPPFPVLSLGPSSWVSHNNNNNNNNNTPAG